VGLRVDQIKVNETIVRNLDSHIASDKIKEAFNFVDLVIDFPPVFFELVVPILLEEQDILGAPCA
jgi:hypothetical protein